MFQVEINYWAVLLSAIVNMGLGFAWYGPLFGKKWMSLSGISEQQIEEFKKAGKNEMNKQYAIAFVAALVMALVLAEFVVFAENYLLLYGVGLGIKVGFMAWLGFVVPVTLSSVLWEKKPWALWGLNAGYYLVLLLVTGVILATWI